MRAKGDSNTLNQHRFLSELIAYCYEVADIRGPTDYEDDDVNDDLDMLSLGKHPTEVDFDALIKYSRFALQRAQTGRLFVDKEACNRIQIERESEKQCVAWTKEAESTGETQATSTESP